jgi:subtilisin-like proprotein convertase family protein
VPVDIPDDDPAGVDVPVNVSGLAGVIGDLDVFLNLPHTYPGDLDITLIGPNGAVVSLGQDTFGTTDDTFAGTTFDDDANPTYSPIRVNGITTSPPSVPATPLQPENALSAFHGLSPNGTWTLHVVDDAGIDTGQVVAFSLVFRTLSVVPLQPRTTVSSTAAVPIPAGTTGAPATVVSPLSVPTGNFADLWDAAGPAGASQRIEVTVNLAHDASSYLTLTLISPLGERYVLAQERGTSTANIYAATKFHESAATDAIGYGSSTPLAEAVPFASLGKLSGAPAAGIWQLEVKNTGPTTGSIAGWSLSFRSSSCDLPR